jgi:transcriptional regulator with XRE-family HTH domain
MTQEPSSTLTAPGEAGCPAIWLEFAAMGTSLAERLQEAMDRRELKVADLVRLTRLSKAAIHFVLNGATKAATIRAVNIDKLAEALDVDREWLLYGRGTPHHSALTPSQSVGLDLATLLHADWWVQYEEEAKGLTPVVSPDRRDDYLRRLAHVYEIARADGGRLSSAHADQIIEAAKGESNGRSVQDRSGN